MREIAGLAILRPALHAFEHGLTLKFWTLTWRAGLRSGSRSRSCKAHRVPDASYTQRKSQGPCKGPARRPKAEVWRNLDNAPVVLVRIHEAKALKRPCSSKERRGRRAQRMPPGRTTE